MSPRPVCVYCRQREAEVRYRPFCSERCQLADLGRWLNGDYRVAADAREEHLSEAEPSDEAADQAG
jgi:endogenous inhibitor of DNA gyrase (YacG/DUF329 family)